MEGNDSLSNKELQEKIYATYDKIIPYLQQHQKDKIQLSDGSIISIEWFVRNGFTSWGIKVTNPKKEQHYIVTYWWTPSNRTIEFWTKAGAEEKPEENISIEDQLKILNYIRDEINPLNRISQRVNRAASQVFSEKKPSTSTQSKSNKETNEEG